MISRGWLIAVVVVAFGLLLGGLVRTDDEKGPKNLVGKPAPDFTMETLDGSTFNLAKEKGNVVVLDFWATWCAPCKAALPHVQELSENKELAAQGLRVVTVDYQDSKDKASELVKNNNYTFTVALDANDVGSKQYLLTGVPCTVIIGRNGIVRNVFEGFTTDDEAKQIGEKGSDFATPTRLEVAVKAALAEKAPGKSS